MLGKVANLISYLNNRGKISYVLCMQFTIWSHSGCDFSTTAILITPNYFPKSCLFRWYRLKIRYTMEPEQNSVKGGRTPAREPGLCNQWKGEETAAMWAVLISVHSRQITTEPAGGERARSCCCAQVRVWTSGTVALWLPFPGARPSFQVAGSKPAQTQGLSHPWTLARHLLLPIRTIPSSPGGRKRVRGTGSVLEPAGSRFRPCLSHLLPARNRLNY